MKSKIFIFLFLLITNAIWGQQNIIDSLKNIINLQRGDTNEVKALLNLADVPGFTNAYKAGVSNIDSSNKYLLKGLLLAKNLKYTRGEAYCYLLLSVSNGNIGNYGQAISFMLKALHIYEQLKLEVTPALLKRLDKETMKAERYSSKHSYTLEEYGFDKEHIYNELKFIFDEFGFESSAHNIVCEPGGKKSI